MLCLLAPIFAGPPVPDPAPPAAGPLAALIITSVGLVGLLAPFGWSRSEPEYTVRTGEAVHLVSGLAAPSAELRYAGAPRRPRAFFARRTAYDTIPPGLAVDAATGALVGVPSMAGSYAVTVGVSDGAADPVFGSTVRVKVLPAS